MYNNQITKLRNASRKLVRELGLLQLNISNSQEPMEYWHAIVEIGKEPGIPISELGKLLLLSDSNISRLVTSMNSKGVVELRAANDKRQKKLYLTTQGEAELKKVDDFSIAKINGALDFLTDQELVQISESISKYSDALERSRKLREGIKIHTLTKSKVIRQQLISMISQIQKDEFHIPITDEVNQCIIDAEGSFYYQNSCNFWYATNDSGQLIGSIGLKKVNSEYSEIKKCFVIKEYRGKGVAQKLLDTAIKAAYKHGFKHIVLGTVKELEAAHKFYLKNGFVQIEQSSLPTEFELCHLDNTFFQYRIF